MALPKAHLVTGGTGFVGSALILELLQRTDYHVVGLVRGSNPWERLRQTLYEAALAYAMPPEILDAIDERCYAISGDVQSPLCGVEWLPSLDYTEVWHSAASLRFEDRYADEIYAINRRGTRHALQVAAFANVKQFNYVSTAYVAGSREGVIMEGPAEGGRTHNIYEASKIEAERLVEAERWLGKRIFRPSIVIGHSRTLAATNYTGMYGFLRKLYGFKGMMARTQAGLLSEKALKLKASGPAELNLVPIDRVVENAVIISQRTQPARGETQYYHLTNPIAPTVEDTISLMFEALDMRRPELVSSTEGFEWLDEKFNSRIDFYRSYLGTPKSFDRTQTNCIVPEEPWDDYALTLDVLKAYYRWYLSRLEEERSELPATR